VPKGALPAGKETRIAQPSRQLEGLPMMPTELLQILENELTRTLDPRRRFVLKNQKRHLVDAVVKRQRAEKLQRTIEASCIRALKTTDFRFASAADEAAFNMAVQADAEEITEH
jgi:hypothetical protein